MTPTYAAHRAGAHSAWASDASLTIGALIALAVVRIAMRIAHSTEFGRTVYAIGGGESSARLMGLSVDSTKIGVYLLSGLTAALGGIVMTFYMLSGYSLHAVGLELDAIAAVVIGGTLLAGGVGYMAGTLFGVLILGIIQTLIAFDGTLSSWWTKIVVGALLLALLPVAAALRGAYAQDGMNAIPFGRLPDGAGSRRASRSARADGLQAEILTLGGTLRSLTLPVQRRATHPAGAVVARSAGLPQGHLVYRPARGPLRQSHRRRRVRARRQTLHAHRQQRPQHAAWR